MARFGRCARLPLAFEGRTKVVAGAGVCAAMYGAGQHHVPEYCLVSVRTANFRAVWRTLFRASPEIVFTVLSATWRADVLAVAITAPWWYLRGAVVRGAIEPAVLATML